MKSWLLTTALISSYAAAAPFVAYAQENQSAAAPPGPTDIIVTAQRREERLQDVPTAITAFNPQLLQQRNIGATQDLLGQVPSLVVGASGQARSSENITIRGMGATFGAAPGVALYFAEVPFPADQMNNAQGAGGGMYFDLGSLQVLRGPQGTLFGRNTTGGAVLFEPQRPVDKLEGYVEGKLGNYDMRELRAAINVPLVADELLVRVAGIRQVRDGFTRDITNNVDLDDRDRWALRAGVLWRPSDRVENYLLMNLFHGNENASSTVLNAVPAGANPLTGEPFSEELNRQIARGIRVVAPSPMNQIDRHRYFALTDNLSIDLNDNLTLRNIASYSRLKHVFSRDTDAYPDDFVAIAQAGLAPVGATETAPGGPLYPNGEIVYTTNLRQITEELQLQGKAFDNNLTYVVGGYFEHTKPVGLQLSISPQANNPFGEVKRSVAVYSQATYTLGDLSVTGGVRYTWDYTRDFGTFNVTNAPVQSNTVRSQEPTWTLGADYKATQDLLLYAKVSRGYKTGGVGRFTPNPDRRAFRPEFVTSYEAGVKADWRLGGTFLRTNLSAYRMDYKDLQRSGADAFDHDNNPLTTPQYGALTVNAGSARIQGLEFEGEIRPVDWFTLSGNYSYTDAEYLEYQLPSIFPFPGGGFDCGAGVGFDGANCVLDDIPFQFAPKNQFSISGNLSLPLPGDAGRAALTVTYAYVDAQYTSPTKAAAAEPFAWIGGNCPRNATGSVVCGPDDGYGLWNAHFTWSDIGGRPLDFSAFVTNLTNVKYVISSESVTAYRGFNALMYGEPRMYGISLRYRFGE